MRWRSLSGPNHANSGRRPNGAGTVDPTNSAAATAATILQGDPAVGVNREGSMGVSEEAYPMAKR
jgi:hypothetical protein